MKGYFDPIYDLVASGSPESENYSDVLNYIDAATRDPVATFAAHGVKPRPGDETLGATLNAGLTRQYADALAGRPLRTGYENDEARFRDDGLARRMGIVGVDAADVAQARNDALGGNPWNLVEMLSRYHNA